MTVEKNTPAELESLRFPELQARFHEVMGKSNRSPNRTFLIRTIVEAVRNGQIRQVVEPAPVEDATLTDQAGEGSLAEGSSTLETPPAEQHECDGCEVCEPAEPCVTTDDMSNGPDGSGAGEVVGQESEPKKRGRFAAMTIEELQAKYLEVVGRATGSSDRGYLIWKIREAEKGRITVGPRQSRTAEGNADEAKTLPLRLDAPSVAAMDAAWRQQGIPSRTEFLRRAIGHYLTQLGATEAATFFRAE